MLIKDILDKIDENTFIISDTHLGHKSILQFEPCRVSAMRIDGFEDHEEWIIHNWNSVVGPNDLVLCLGDFAFGKRKDTKEFIEFCKLTEGIDETTLVNLLGYCESKNLQDINKFIRDNIKTE